MNDFLKLIILIATMFLNSCSESEKYGHTMNSFRKNHDGIELKDYSKFGFDSNDNKNAGVSFYIITPDAEKQFRMQHKGYLESKFINYSKDGIIREENILRKTMNDSLEWFMSTSNYYKEDRVSGFIVMQKRGIHSIEDEYQLTKETRDSVLTSWKL